MHETSADTVLAAAPQEKEMEVEQRDTIPATPTDQIYAPAIAPAEVGGGVGWRDAMHGRAAMHGHSPQPTPLGMHI